MVFPLRSSVLVAALAVAACQQDRVISLPIHHPSPGSPLTAFPSERVQVVAVTAENAPLGGVLQDFDGETFARITLYTDPAIAIRIALEAELEVAGHSLVEDEAAIRFEAVVEAFTASFDPDPLNGSRTVEVEVVLTTTGSRYRATATTGPRFQPSELLYSRLTRQCVAQIASQFRNDPRVHALFEGS